MSRFRPHETRMETEGGGIIGATTVPVLARVEDCVVEREGG